MEGGSQSNGGLLYHEVQESKLCAVHCVNTVLQGPFFSELDLAALASDLDRGERQMMMMETDASQVGGVGGFLSEDSYNVSVDGDFSIQVLQKALEVWDLHVIPLDSPVAEPTKHDPERENGYICHLQNHWFCIRKVNGEWYNFNSLYAAPEHLTKFYLSAYLDSLMSSGWTIFVVRGNFPGECPIPPSDSSNGFGQWLTPEDAERITKSCNQKRVTEQRADPGDVDEISQEEEADLNAAIQASLMDASAFAADGCRTTGEPLHSGSRADDTAGSSSGDGGGVGSMLASSERMLKPCSQKEDATFGGDVSAPSIHVEGGISDEEEAKLLSAAIEASLADASEFATGFTEQDDSRYHGVHRS